MSRALLPLLYVIVPLLLAAIGWQVWKRQAELRRRAAEREAAMLAELRLASSKRREDPEDAASGTATVAAGALPPDTGTPPAAPAAPSAAAPAAAAPRLLEPGHALVHLALKSALPAHFVFPRIRLSDVVSPHAPDGALHTVDFVVCGRSTEVVAAVLVERADQSHRVVQVQLAFSGIGCVTVALPPPRPAELARRVLEAAARPHA